jgi:hypothetical protein
VESLRLSDGWLKSGPAWVRVEIYRDGDDTRLRSPTTSMAPIESIRSGLPRQSRSSDARETLCLLRLSLRLRISRSPCANFYAPRLMARN